MNIFLINDESVHPHYIDLKHLHCPSHVSRSENCSPTQTFLFEVHRDYKLRESALPRFIVPAPQNHEENGQSSKQHDFVFLLSEPAKLHSQSGLVAHYKEIQPLETHQLNLEGGAL